MTKPVLSLLPGRLAIYRLPPDAPLPAFAADEAFLCITRSVDELSIVCREGLLDNDGLCQVGRRALMVQGPLDFGLVGILAGIAGALAQAQVSIFAISTYDTDYILVAEEDLEKAVAALRAQGYPVM